MTPLQSGTAMTRLVALERVASGVETIVQHRARLVRHRRFTTATTRRHVRMPEGIGVLQRQVAAAGANRQHVAQQLDTAVIRCAVVGRPHLAVLLTVELRQDIVGIRHVNRVSPNTAVLKIAVLQQTDVMVARVMEYVKVEKTIGIVI